MNNGQTGRERGLQLVLASTSESRRILLERLRLPFSVCAPNVDETPLPGELPGALVTRLAEAKARAVALLQPGALIIGSDQTAYLDGAYIGKPLTRARAIQQLECAAGRSMQFYTGLCLVNSRDNSLQLDCIPFRVHFRALSRRQIEGYLDREQPYHCAGSFQSESLGAALFDRMEGDDPSALMGLPLIRLVAMLNAAGVDVLTTE